MKAYRFRVTIERTYNNFGIGIGIYYSDEKYFYVDLPFFSVYIGKLAIR